MLRLQRKDAGIRLGLPLNLIAFLLIVVVIYLCKTATVHSRQTEIETPNAAVPSVACDPAYSVRDVPLSLPPFSPSPSLPLVCQQAANISVASP